MSYHSERRQRLLAQKAQYEKTLTSLYSSLDDAAASGIESYRFDSGEGSQSTKRRSLKDIHELIQFYEARLSWVINELNNMGIVTLQLRRKMTR